MTRTPSYTLPEIVAQLDGCDYQCEAGPLANNVYYIRLKETAALEEREVRQLSEEVPVSFLDFEQRRACSSCRVVFLNVEGDCPVCHYRVMAHRFGARMLEVTGEVERIARVAETANNLLGALQLRLPPERHVEGCRSGVEGMRDELRRIVIELKGSDPWAGHPGWDQEGQQG